MKLKFSIAFAAVVAALAMPPTADASTKPQGFYDYQADPNNLGSAVINTAADDELLVPTDFILTSASHAIGKLALADEPSALNTAVAITGIMIVLDQEVGPMGNSDVLGSPTTNAAKKPQKNRADHPNARSTMQSQPTRTNSDEAVTLVDLGIVNRR